jgi:hypothetical protein
MQTEQKEKCSSTEQKQVEDCRYIVAFLSQRYFCKLDLVLLRF